MLTIAGRIGVNDSTRVIFFNSPKRFKFWKAFEYQTIVFSIQMIFTASKLCDHSDDLNTKQCCLDLQPFVLYSDFGGSALDTHCIQILKINYLNVA